MPLSLLVDIGSLFYAFVNVFHPDWQIRSIFRLHRSDNLHKDSHQNSWIYPRVKNEVTERADLGSVTIDIKPLISIRRTS